MPYSFNDEKFTRLMTPLGMHRNKGLWVYYRNTPLFRETLSRCDGDVVRTTKLLNAYLNNSTITWQGWHYSASWVVARGYIYQVFTKRSIARYEKAIKILIGESQ